MNKKYISSLDAPAIKRNVLKYISKDNYLLRLSLNIFQIGISSQVAVAHTSATGTAILIEYIST